MATPLVTVIIPVYNTERYLKKCLYSIVNQTFKNLEIILINDGSTDNSPVICDEYATLDNRIKVLHIENQGVSYARNLGILKSNGNYISFIDSDDWLELCAYEILTNCLSEHKTDIVIFEYFVNFENGVEIPKAHKELNGFMTKVKAIEITIAPINRFSVTKIYKRQSLKNVRYEQSIYIGEDTLFACSALNNADSVYYLAQPIYHYLQSSNSASRSGFNNKKFTGIIAYYQLVELCKINYPQIVDLAIFAYKSLIINIIIDLYNFPAYPDSKNIITNLTLEIRNNSSTLFLSNKLTIKEKIKMAMFNINPRLLYLIRKYLK